MSKYEEIYIHPYYTTYISKKGVEKTRKILCMDFQSHLKMIVVIYKYREVIEDIASLEVRPELWNRHDHDLYNGLIGNIGYPIDGGHHTDLTDIQLDKWEIALQKIGYKSLNDFAKEQCGYCIHESHDWSARDVAMEQNKRRAHTAELDAEHV